MHITHFINSIVNDGIWKTPFIKLEKKTIVFKTISIKYFTESSASPMSSSQVNSKWQISM